jgi:hypothetical protein
MMLIHSNIPATLQRMPNIRPPNNTQTIFPISLIYSSVSVNLFQKSIANKSNIVNHHSYGIKCILNTLTACNQLDIMKNGG